MSVADVRGERELWGAVVNQAIIDALWDDAHSGVVCRHDHQLAARRWIGSRGFRLVCTLAGLEPEFVEGRVRPLLDDPEAAREFVVRLRGGEMARRRSQGLRLQRGPALPGGSRCRVPGCGAALDRRSGTGLCREHNHFKGLCGCRRCRP